jgi:hypothetical protein
MPTTEELFNADLKDVHLIYDYNVLVNGQQESKLHHLRLQDCFYDIHESWADYYVEWKYEVCFSV